MVGGIISVLSGLIFFLYNVYNFEMFYKDLILNKILAENSSYPAEFHLSKIYDKFLYKYDYCFCLTKRLLKKKENKNDLNKAVNMSACKLILEEKMDIGNFLHDSMDFYCIRQLIMKSRHKILVPLLIIHLTKTKTIKSKGYKGSFYRNIHERTD